MGRAAAYHLNPNIGGGHPLNGLPGTAAEEKYRGTSNQQKRNFPSAPEALACKIGPTRTISGFLS